MAILCKGQQAEHGSTHTKSDTLYRKVKHRSPPKSSPHANTRSALQPGFDLYKIFVCFEAVVHESTILSSLPTVVQYSCTIIGQYETLLPIFRLYALHHTILVIKIPCNNGQPGRRSRRRRRRDSMCTYVYEYIYEYIYIYTHT